VKITFVHTPMPVNPIPERELFWRNFDIQYHSAHPGLRHMEGNMWELPHWMHWLAGVLNQEGFTSLDVLDLYSSEIAVAGIDTASVNVALRRHRADVYLFSPMTANINFAYAIANLIKSQYRESTIVFGGIMATPLHREVASHPSVDYVVFDRGEYALPALLKALRSECKITTIGNISYKDREREIITNEIRYPYAPVNEIPFPKIDLFPPSTGAALRYIRIVHALGCPYKCPFCTIQTIGRKADYFAIDRVLSEIRAYKEYYGEHHNIYWGDETFTLDTTRTLELCAALETEGNISYDCQTRLNCLSKPSVVRALAASGCRWVEVGLETMNQQSQDIFKQGIKIRTAEEVLASIRDEGIAACSFMVNGFPNQTVDEMKRSIDWTCELIERNLLQASYLQVLVPYPGGDLYEHPERYGMRIHHRKYEYYSEDMCPVFDSSFATADESYRIFTEGLVALAQAMEKKPYFGDIPPLEEIDKFGRFWADSHA
jgi:anaerobic magnesium-protoporphyrin IX monomethyl ester cyclase